MNHITALVVPQVNVNDDTVLLARWRVADGGEVAAGDLVCDVETSKAAAEITATAPGILVHAAVEGSHPAVGATIGAIGPTRAAAAAFLSAPAAARGADSAGATPKAMALAAQNRVDLAAVRAAGVVGTIKEADVRRFIADAPPQLPAGLAPYVEREGPLSAFDAAVAANLRRSTTHLVLASVDMECRLSAVQQRLREAHAAGRMVSLLHFVIAAAGRVLPGFSRLTSFAWDGTIYRHRAIDVAFVARTSDGRLFTPVIRGADRRSVDDVASASQALTLQAMRGSAKAADFEGAAFTISQVPIAGTTRVMALPSFGQSAILGVSAERTAAVVDGESIVAARVVTLTLNYDHVLCDGVYAANFLAALVKDLESPAA